LELPSTSAKHRASSSKHLYLGAGIRSCKEVANGGAGKGGSHARPSARHGRDGRDGNLFLVKARRIRVSRFPASCPGHTDRAWAQATRAARSGALACIVLGKRA
jgi:hypothetical protein